MTTLLALILQSVFALQPTVPSVDFKFWNDYGHVYKNNCYNYSTNRMTDSFAQPGEASGIQLWDMACSQVVAAASQDLGMTPSTYFEYSRKEDDSLIALVVAPGYDYHWYRRGDDGLWTHKMGNLPATNHDSQDKVIATPESADRGNYTEFCGYFRIKNYIYEPHEQNGGYVRIGNMRALPDDPHSELVIMKYSGRRNPTYPLKDYLQNPVFKAQLLGLRDGMRMAPLATSRQVGQLSKLGYSGIMIVDHEGLIFPKASRVQILDTEVLGYMGGAEAPLGLTMAQPMVMERSFAPQ